MLGPGGAYASPPLHALTRHGALGVDLFFGISGFLITSRLLEEQERYGRISLRGFYIRRVLRIFPAYFTYLAVVIGLSLLGVLTVTAPEWWTCVFFVRNYLPLPAEGGWYTAHLWSLGIEEHFYLLWPGLLLLWGSTRARWGVIALALGIAAWRVIEFRLQAVPQLLPGVPFYTRTDIRFDALLWGCWLALLFQQPEVRNWFARLYSGWLWTTLVVLLALCVRYQPPLALMWQSLLIALVILGPVLRPGRVVGRILELQAVRWIGRLSYSLYLWQQLFLTGREAPRPLPFGPLQSLPLNVLAVFLCAAASYYIIDRRLTRLGHRLSRPRTGGRL